MLLAYIDEIGESGAFVSYEDKKYRTSPAFGYAGFIIPARHSREFGSIFTKEKRQRFKKELALADNPGRWEAKGSDLFRPDTLDKRPENLRIFGSLVAAITNFDGMLFYYANEKPLGTPRQTNLDKDLREKDAMEEMLNRVARFAGSRDQNIMVLMDSVNEKKRNEKVAEMYAHIFSRTAEFPEMRFIVEPPMHIDSQLSSNIQFADWVAAFVTRAIDRQLIEDSNYMWVSSKRACGRVLGSFTFESKLHLHHRACEDFYHSDILKPERRIYPYSEGLPLHKRIGNTQMRRIKAAAERAHGGGNR